MLTIGMTMQKEMIVQKDQTAEAMGSGGLAVFATPALVALMEAAAMALAADGLPEGQGTVGTLIAVRHTAPTPVGMAVRCEARLTGMDGRRLSFAIRAFDETGPIGEAEHERAIVDNARFLAKTYAKLPKP